MKKLICFLLPILILVSCQSGPEPLVASKVDLIPSVYPISSAIEPGPTETGLYRTVTPFEHARCRADSRLPCRLRGFSERHRSRTL